MVDENAGTLLRRGSKRQRVLKFFKTWKQKQSQGRHEGSIAPEHDKTFSQASPRPTPDLTPQEQPTNPPDHGRMAPVHEAEQVRAPTPPQESKEDEAEYLNEGQLRALFAGAPQFGITSVHGRCTATASYPWNAEAATKDAADTAPLAEPAFSAATLQKHQLKAEPLPEAPKEYNGYVVDVVEVPCMLGTQGIEPGTIGFSHFLQLPKSDSLDNGLADSQSTIEFLESDKNKEILQTNPERLGIRPVELGLIYDRLSEFQDMYEAFHDSPEPMTILNNQTSGDLYANLFTKFLTPPGYDGSTDDPTGLQTQIAALLRVLGLPGIWYDFSLVEWRIRLGQILWSEQEPTPEHEPQPLWTEREILLLQITLACELLLRLDAFTNADATDAAVRLRINPQDVEGFLHNKTRKVDWDLVLARRFLDNIAITRGNDTHTTPKPKSRGLMSLFAQNAHHELPQSNLILFPQHQARQMAGFLHFATTIQWPGLDAVYADLVRKLGPQDETEDVTPTSSSGKLLDSATPSGISVYGTPLQTPLTSGHQLDSYFGQVGKPVLNRNNSRAFRMALSPTSSLPEGQSKTVVNNVGGWLSRSYLTGLVLPGEAISHFLISTLLENDAAAIANLGDSANLYGGFTFGGRSFWSKNSVVGRILACVKGSTECMGWVSCPKLPECLAERWYSIHSEMLPYGNRMRDRDGSDIVSGDSAVVPGGFTTSVKSEDFVLPRDLDPTPATSISFTQWDLSPLNPDLVDGDSVTGPPTESDIHSPSMRFVLSDTAVSHTLTLGYDVQFVTSWPCTNAASAPPTFTHRPKVLRRSVTGTLSRSSSKHSETLSRRNSHGFEPLLSHPPDAADIAPKRMYDSAVEGSVTSSKPMEGHMLHKSYSHKVVPVTDVLDPDFLLPFELHTSKSSDRLLALSQSLESEAETIKENKKAVLVLDSRASPDSELLARAWCADKGLHALNTANKPVIAVVGAGPGIGEAVAHRFAAEGFVVALLARTEEVLQTMTRTINNDIGPSTAHYYITDLRVEDTVTSSFQRIRAELGPVTVLVYNAGARRVNGRSLIDTTSEEFENFTKINLFGAFWASKLVLPDMLAAGKGTILFTSATGALRGMPGLASFSPGKFGLRSLCQVITREYQAKGIHAVNIIVDGPVDGKLIGGVMKRHWERTGQTDKAADVESHLVQPKDLAQTYWFLHCQPKSTWTQELDVRAMKETLFTKL
ncbi:nad(P)-binding protein [Stemphylium lycopersici]|uniref:Nad(P)-binding protein n=1 Tax=Stemphylium lycopersici TaxID=183478 RepID=A0A364NGC1_STELY|nr:nad(P)-binding protein [Stemphylium lycopersici]RAR16384.1 nad(P)-binding protein [Stemphylium lycopersici]